ncbi:MAG: GNAT family N-acetyltransferase [Chloroflexi bacterium]|nr:MAG: GNAT family N-acetyltransferase [Chloroflexota bacterium]
MRPGHVEDLPAVVRLWEREVLAGRRDSAPHGRFMQRILSGFDWEACSRVEEDATGMRGVALVLRRHTEDTTVARVEAAVAWRMDRSFDGPLPAVVPVDGYRLLESASVPPAAWVDTFNGSFADHWRHTDRAVEELRLGRWPELELMAADSAGKPAAITLCEIEKYEVDLRPQPVGLVGSVGTLPAHRRRGLARWLVTESLARLKAAGAATASLYVDGKNEHRAPDLYSDLGFEVTFDTTVWEATFP